MIGNGCVIAIGGNESKRGAKDSILAAFVERAGGPAARIVVIPSASVEPEVRAEMYGRLFARFGATDVRAVHAERGVTPADLEAIRRATGIFVTGGDQKRLMEALRGTGAAEAIRMSVRSGAVYAGTSAGASAVSERMLAGSTRRRGTEVISFGEGLGLVPDVIVDQHFAQRRRLPRLIAAARDHRLTGVGIDENTAIVWTSNGATVTGAGEVTIVDPEHRLEDARARSYRLHVLGRGARWEFGAGEEAEEGAA